MKDKIFQLEKSLNRAVEIADDAIRLADIDYENDKFGKVTGLRSELDAIKKTLNLETK